MRRKKNTVKPYTPNDKYFYKAKKQGLRARSAFKLEEIQERYNFVKPNQKVLDLGAAPGSFLQHLSNFVGEKGLVIGVDLQEIKPFKNPNIHTFVADIYQPDDFKPHFEKLKITKFNIITADLAPKTTGIKDIDQYRSVELNDQVLKIIKQYLKPGGILLTKIFTGEDFDQFFRFFKRFFKKSTVLKPKACRERSKEVYLLGRGFHGEIH